MPSQTPKSYQFVPAEKETTNGYGAERHTAGNAKKFRYVSGDIVDGVYFIEQQKIFAALLYSISRLFQDGIFLKVFIIMARIIDNVMQAP